MIYNSAGQLVPSEILISNDFCIVNGITIIASGTTFSPAPNNPNYNYCFPSASYSSMSGLATGTSTTGTTTYSFSQPIHNVTVTYVGVNDNDTGTIAINNTGMQLSNLGGLSAVGSLLSCTFPSGTFGDVSLTISSPNPFTSITLTNTGGQSGWQTGNLCNFIFGSEIQNCDKVYLDLDICYHETQAQTTTYTAFNHSANGYMNENCEPCLINGVPCSASNVTIEPIGPIPYGCIINPNGTVTFPAGTPPFDMHTEGQLYYNLRSIQNPTVVSGPYRLNFGIEPKALPKTPNIWINNASSTNPSYYVNGSVNVLTDSYVRASITGDCDSIIAADIGPLNQENKVTLHELTSPQNPYYQLDTQTGSIIYRPPYSNTNQPPMPTLPQCGYQLTYEMCVNHNGVTTFCEWAYIDINYVFANRIANPNHIVKVYPNPSIDGVYTLTFEEKFATAIMEVYNLMGILVHHEEVNLLMK